MGRGAPPQAFTRRVEGTETDEKRLLTENPPFCGQCCVRCDPGTVILHRVYQDGVLLETKAFCCRACFLDWIETEIVDDRVVVAKRQELTWLHSHVCPACKGRLRECIAAGDLPEEET